MKIPRGPKEKSPPQPEVAPRPTEADVRKAIQFAGYPLEQRVALLADHVGFAVMPNWTYWDRRKDTERELDLAASSRFTADGHHVEIHVLSECKTASNGLVVFESREALHRYSRDVIKDAHFWGQPAWIGKSASMDVGYSPVSEFGWGSSRWAPADVTAYQYGAVTYNKNSHGHHPWKVENADLHASIDGLCRALLEYREEHGQVVEGSTDVFLNLAAMLLVTEGPIYASSPVPRPEIRVVPRATYYRRGFTNDRERVVFRIDFVNEKALLGVLDEIHSAGFAIASRLGRVETISASVRKFGNTKKKPGP